MLLKLSIFALLFINFVFENAFVIKLQKSVTILNILIILYFIFLPIWENLFVIKFAHKSVVVYIKEAD